MAGDESFGPTLPPEEQPGQVDLPDIFNTPVSPTSSGPELPQFKSDDSAEQSPSSNDETHSGVALLPLPPKNKPSPKPPVVTPSTAALPASERKEEHLKKAKSRQAVFLQKRRERKRKRSLFNRFRVMMRLVTSMLLIAGFYFAVTSDYWMFHPSQIQFHNTGLVTANHLAPYMQPLANKPIYAVNPYTLSQAIRKDIPIIDRIYIRRQLFPVGLDITVDEKPSWGVFYTQPPGTIESLSAPEPTSSHLSVVDLKPIPKITPILIKPLYLAHWDNTVTNLDQYPEAKISTDGPKAPVLLVGDPSRFESLQLLRIRDITRYFKTLAPQVRLQYLDIRDAGDLIAVFSGFTVHLGHSDHSLLERTFRLASLIPIIQTKAQEIDFVDLRWGQQVLFKKHPSPETAKP